jgi:hypothetical protein
MAAYFGGLEYRIDPAAQMSALDDQYDDLTRDPAAKRGLSRLLRPVRVGIRGAGNGVTRLPRDYAYEDAAPRAWVRARTAFGPPIDLYPVVPEGDDEASKARREELLNAHGSEELRSREAFARWLTEDQPRFAEVLVCRMVERLLGIQLVSSVDPWTDETVVVHPALLEHLSGLFRASGHDLRDLQRTLTRTRAYQRTTAGRERRLSAEQLWDSLLTLIVPDVDAELSPPASAITEQVYANFEGMTGWSAEELAERADFAALRYRDAERYQEVRAELRKENKARNRQVSRLTSKLKRARRKGDAAEEKKLLAELAALDHDPDHTVALKRERRRQKGLVRASDLPAPAPPGHFLQEFGQSNREEILGGHTDATVPQALALMNGIVEDQLIGRDGTAIGAELFAAATPGEQIENAYLAILTRPPHSDERDRWLAAMMAEGPAAIDDLIWVLVNSHEFRLRP